LVWRRNGRRTEPSGEA